MRFSFVTDKVTDLVVMRRSWGAWLISKLAKLFVKRDNELAVMLLDKGLYGDAEDESRLPSATEQTG
jgi:hypothetical protein